MIMELLQDVDKVLQTCRESIKKQNKANDQVHGYIYGIQQTIGSFMKANKELNQELVTIHEHQQRLFNHFIGLGILSPMENETVYSYAERIIHLIHTQNKHHKKQTKDCQELLEEHGVLLFQSEDLFEGIRTLIEGMKEKESPKQNLDHLTSPGQWREFLNRFKGGQDPKPTATKVDGDPKPEFDEEKCKLEAEMNCIKSLVNLGMEYSQAEQSLQNIKTAIRITNAWKDAARQNGLPKYQSTTPRSHA